MNDLEQCIYTRGLENLYGSILLGEERCLADTEHLVYLTRELTAPTGFQQTLKEELLFISSVFAVCWPENILNIHLADERLDVCPVARGNFSHRICRSLFQAENQGIVPNQLNIWREGQALHYRISAELQIWDEGAVVDE